MTTCSIPVYDKINNALSGGPLYRIYGVISIDILIKDFSEYGSEDEINKELRKRTINVCSTSIFEPTECQLNSLRTNKCNNINTSCSGLDYLIPQCDLDNIPNKLFCNEKDNSLTQDNITYCCENLCKVKGALIGGLIGGIVGLIVIVILVWYFMCRKKDDDGNNNKGETPKLILVVKTDKQLSENKNLTTSDNVKEKTTSENLKTNENPQNGIKNENPIIDTKGSQNISPKPISNNSYVNKDHVNIDNGENNDQNNNKNDSDINISRKNSNDRKFPPHIFEMDDHQL